MREWRSGATRQKVAGGKFLAKASESCTRSRECVPKATRLTNKVVKIHVNLKYTMREWLSGRALPCQGKCRGSESRLPLHLWHHSQAVRHGSAKPLSPGSNPGGASKKQATLLGCLFF